MMIPVLLISVLAGCTAVVSGAENECLKAAEACYPDTTRDVIRQAMRQSPINLGQACNQYKYVMSCMDDAKTKQDCAAVSVYMEDLTSNITNDVYKVCYKNGTVSKCAVEFKICTDAYTKIMNNQKSTSSVAKIQSCGYRSMFFSCTANIVDNALCPPDGLKNQLMNNYLAQLKSLNLEAICDTDCGKAVGKCLEDLSKDILEPALNIGVACPHYATALTCLKDRKTNECKGDQSNVTDINLAVYDMQDYCTESGGASQCYNNTLKCHYDAAKMKEVSKDNRCQRFSEYLQCVDTAKCSSIYWDEVVRPLKVELVMEERNENCAAIGDCAQQLESCTSPLYRSIGLVASNTTSTCSVAQETFKCTCRLNKADICSSEPGLITEELGRKEIKHLPKTCSDAGIPLQTCDGTDEGPGGASTLQVATVLLAVTSLLSFLRL